MIDNLASCPKYLGYIVEENCECSDGRSEYKFVCVCQGKNKEEILQNYLDNVLLLYEVDLSKDMPYISGLSYMYYHEIKFSKIPEVVFGYADKLEIEAIFKEHEE